MLCICGSRQGIFGTENVETESWHISPFTEQMQYHKIGPKS